MKMHRELAGNAMRTGSGSDVPRIGCVSAILSSWCAVGILIGAALSCEACGGRLTPYAVEHAHCAANEETIVQREGTTAEEDAEAMELERARCTEALRAIRGIDGGAP